MSNIDVAVGLERREYFSIIRKVLLDINGSFQGLNVTEKIPCVCSECKGRETPYFFDYEYLRKRMHKEKLTVDCERSVEEVAINELLSGIETPAMEPFESWDVLTL